MPLFEYRCSNCSSKFAKLVGMTADSSDPVCPKCGSADVSKLISRFTRIRSEDDVLESLEDSALSADMSDPKSARKWMEEMGKGLGEEAGEDMGEYMDEAERELYDGGDEVG